MKVQFLKGSFRRAFFFSVYTDKMNVMSLRIGICDSGIGGLSVLKELYKHVPVEYVYIGDSRRAPYGNKCRQELLLYTKELLTFLKHKDIDIYVSACNSISTLDTQSLVESLGIDEDNYIDMRDFAEATKDIIPEAAKLLMYGTVATIESGVYQDVFKGWNTSILSSAQLAYAIETKQQIEIDVEVDTLVDYVLQEGVTHIFLACTHYPLIQNYLDLRFRGMGVVFINPAKHIPEKLMRKTRKEKSDKHTLTVFTTRTSEAMNEYVHDIDDVQQLLVEL